MKKKTFSVEAFKCSINDRLATSFISDRELSQLCLTLRMSCMKPAIMVALDILRKMKYQLDAFQVLEAPIAMMILKRSSLTPANTAENIADNACQIR